MKWLICISILAASLHPFHLSVAEIYFNEDAQTLEIEMKVFIDDMEEGLKQSGYGDVKLGPELETKEVDAILFQYLKNNLNLVVNGDTVDLSFYGKEYEPGNIMWCYMEVQNVTDIHKIVIRNHLLTEVFSDQQNIVHVKKGGKTRSLRLRKGSDLGELIY